MSSHTHTHSIKREGEGVREENLSSYLTKSTEYLLECG